jgi:hypothetical protein
MVAAPRITTKAAAETCGLLRAYCNRSCIIHSH